MSIGRLIRQLAGRHEEAICRAYRRIFVNVGRIADDLSRAVPAGGHVVEIGGGDGMLMNALLDRRQDITAALLDIAPTVGTMISAENLSRVSLHPGTPMEQYAGPAPDVVMVCDVMHHVPVVERQEFIATALALAGDGALLVKDIAPHHPRSWLGYISDRFISNVPVSLVSPAQLQRMAGGRMTRIRTGATISNYIVALRRNRHPA